MIDLLSLNGFVTFAKFSVEMISSVFGLIRKGDVMFSIDLKNSYFQIPVHLKSRPYLQFVVQRKVYQFRIICFGISTAPQVFTRGFDLVSQWAHQRGIWLFRYLDD